jgi:hypothetical protein
MEYRPLLLALVIPLSACKRSPSSATNAATTSSPDLSVPTSSPDKPKTSAQTTDPGFERVLDKHFGADTSKKEEMRRIKRQLDAEVDAELKLAETNRRTMVVAAPAGFTPEPVDRKIRLEVILEKSRIHSNEPLRYRLEMTNIGRQPLDYSETSPSVFKFNGLGYSRTIKFFVTDPRGKREELISAHAYDKNPTSGGGEPETETPKPEYLPDDMPEAKKEKWFLETQAFATATQNFHVRLLPGEVLRSNGDTNAAEKSFRTLWCEQHFDQAGKYKLEVVLDDRPDPLSKLLVDTLVKAGETIDSIKHQHAEQMHNALGPATSNSVVFEVIP